MTTQELSHTPAEQAQTEQALRLLQASGGEVTTVINTDTVDQAIDQVQTQLAQEHGLDLQQRQPALRVDTPEQYEVVGSLVVDLKKRRRAVVDHYAPMKKAANNVVATIRASENERLARLDVMIAAASRGLVAYEAAAKAAREAAEREAQRKAEEEEAARVAQEVAELEAQGDTEAAEELAAAPIVPQHVPAAPANVGVVPKVAGLSISGRWGARIVDLPRFLRWVAQDPATRGHFVTPNMVALNGQARSARQAMAIPGVVAEEERGTVGRGR
jgi:hypothetical protein